MSGYPLKSHQSKVDTEAYKPKLISYFTPPTACATLKNYMSHMRVDEASQHVNKDWLIIEFGNKLCLKLRMDGDHQHYVSNKVRELARLVLETSKCCKSVSLLEHCFLPKHFDFLVEAAT